MTQHQQNISATAAICDDLALARLARDEDNRDILPEPSKEDLQGLADILIEIVGDTLEGSSLSDQVPGILYSLVYLWHRQALQASRKADQYADETKALLVQQDGSEIKDLELQRAQEEAHRRDQQASLFEEVCDLAAQTYEGATGTAWLPPAGRSKRGYQSASIVDGKDFLRAREARRNALVSDPNAPVVVFSGGVQYNDSDRIWRMLDCNKEARPNMILVTSGQDKGADAIAHAWARSRDIEAIRFGLDRKHGKRAAFVRNEAMLDLGNFVGVIVAKGSGVQEALVRESKRRSLSVRRLGFET